jgi:hypothetical protein
MLNNKPFSCKGVKLYIGKGNTEISLEFNTSAVRKERPDNLYTLKKGSLLFSVPIAFKKRKHEYTKKGVERKFPYCDYELVPKSDWNYAFCGREFETCFKGVSDIPFSGENPPVTITAKLININWGHRFMFETVCAKVPKSTQPISEVKSIEMFPYGCSKLRMTEMPLSE